MTGREKIVAHMAAWRVDFAKKKGEQLRADGYRDIYFERCEPTDAETIQEAFGFVLDRLDAIEGTKKK